MTGVVDSIDVSVEVWGGLVTDIAPSDLPHGTSPDCQDVQFQIGGVKTRPGVSSLIQLTGGKCNYLKTYKNVNEVPRFLSLGGDGTLRTDITPGGLLSQIYTGIIPGAFCKSDSLFSNEYFAFSDGQNGLDLPRQYNDTNFDRISQVGPGAAPTVVDSGAAGNISAGVHEVTVIFVTRSGYYTKPGPPTKWTAGGGKQAALTDIAIGPPNVIARVLSFTAANQASFRHLGPLGLTLANSNMYIADNTTTSLTVDFSDAVLLLGTNDDPLFLQIELPPVAGCIGYSNRLFAWGEQANVQNFLNLTFDGGFGAVGVSPVSTSAGPNRPSAAINYPPTLSTPWLNPNNVFAADGIYATCNLATPAGGSDNLFVSGFNLAVPSNATIAGVVTTVLAKSTFGNAYDLSVQLAKAGNIFGSQLATHAVFGAAPANRTYGGPSNLCGLTLTPAEVNDPGFGFSISVFDPTGTSVFFIDYIGIQVFYTTPIAGATVGPLGWTRGVTYPGGSAALTSGLTAVFGDAFAITGDGVSPVVGLITQSAATDYLLNPILLPGTAYGVRARLAKAGPLAAGTVHVNLQSTSGAFTSPGLGIQAGQLTGTYQAFTGTLTSALGIIPGDLLLQVYADGTPTNGGTFLVDNIEIYQLNPQWSGSVVRASKGQLDTQGQESYDSETGKIEYNLNDGQSVRSCFMIRERLYIAKEHSFGVTQDNGDSEPSTWAVGDVSKTVGTPSVNGVGIGEDWAVIAHRTGLYLYWGGEPVKISQEIQPTWDSINWQYGWTIAVTVDTRKRRILICAPFGTATQPNKTLVLDYHDVGSDASAIALNAPIHLTYTGNKKAFDRARKWCPWTIPANSIAQIELSNGQTGIYFGANDGTGNVNVLDDTGTVFTDNPGVLLGPQIIPSYYTTAAFAELPTEEAKQLRSHRHLYSYLTFYALGSGQLGITAYPNSLSNAIALNPQALANPSFKDTEMMLNISAERVFFKFSSSGVGQFFDLQRACVSVRPEPWAIVRGTN